MIAFSYIHYSSDQTIMNIRMVSILGLLFNMVCKDNRVYDTITNRNISNAEIANNIELPDGKIGSVYSHITGNQLSTFNAGNQLNLGIKDFSWNIWMYYRQHNSFDSFLISVNLDDGSFSVIPVNAPGGLNHGRTAIFIKNIEYSNSNITAKYQNWSNVLLCRKNGIFYYFIDGKLVLTITNQTLYNLNLAGKEISFFSVYRNYGYDTVRSITGYCWKNYVIDKCLHTTPFNPYNNLHEEIDCYTIIEDDKELYGN